MSGSCFIFRVYHSRGIEPSSPPKEESMPVDVGRTLRQALLKLTAEKLRIDQQIGAIETFLR